MYMMYIILYNLPKVNRKDKTRVFNQNIHANNIEINTKYSKPAYRKCMCRIQRILLFEKNFDLILIIVFINNEILNRDKITI